MPRIPTAARRALVQERKTQILAAAARVFGAKGYERATISDIAHQAGMAEGSIYNYFKSKSDLLVNLPRQVILPELNQLPELAQTHSPEETLTRMANLMLKAISQNAALFRILLTALPTMKKEVREQYFQQVVMYALGMLEAYFADQVHAGVFDPTLDPALLSRSFVGMFFPYILLRDILQIEPHDGPGFEKIVATNVRTFLHGVMASSVDHASRPNAPGRRTIPVE